MDATRALTMLDDLDPLGELPRTGWILGGVMPAETVAAHTAAVALLVAALVDAVRAGGGTVDGERALRMALVHDAPEARTGDVPMPSKTPALAAALAAHEAVVAAEILPDGLHRDWEAGERGDSIEARLVAAADKIQMLNKLALLERQGRAGHPRFARMWQNPGNLRGVDIPAVRALYEAVFAKAGRPVPAGPLEDSLRLSPAAP